MRHAVFLSLLPFLLAADDHWSNSPRPLRSLHRRRPPRTRHHVRFQEFRHALGQLVGEPDLQTPSRPHPGFKNARGWTSPRPSPKAATLRIVLQDKSPVAPPSTPTHAPPPEIQYRPDAARLRARPPRILSTFEVKESASRRRSPAQPDLDWARIHVLVVIPNTSASSRAALQSPQGCRRGARIPQLHRKSRADIEAQAVRHLAAGNFQTTSLSSLPMADSDFPEKPVSDIDIRLAAPIFWPAPPPPPSIRPCSAPTKR